MRQRLPAGGRDEAVSSVVGTLLMLGITVTVFTAVSIGVLAYFDAQPTAPRSDLGAMQGDDTMLLVHRGGESVPVATGVLYVNVAGIEKRVELADLPGAAAIGDTWDLGESLCIQGAGSTCKYSSSQDVRGAVLVDDRFLLVAQGERGSSDPCPDDTSPPTVHLWTQLPANMGTLSSGPVAVTVELTDACYGVDTTIDPHLWWRLNDGSNPAYTDTGEMTLAAGTTWQGTIPSQTWMSQGGKTLQYYITGQRDLGSNVQSGVTDVQSDAVDDLCPSDTAAPTVLTWSQSPTDVRITTNGAVTVTAVLTDDCYGVSESTNPTLHYRINPGSNPAYTSLGAMTKTATSTWQGTIPSQSWGTLGGQSLQYYLTGQKDLYGHTQTGVTQVQADTIDVIPPAYPVSNTPTTGTVTNFANLQSASDSNAVATVAEGATGGSGTLSFNANAVSSAGGWTNGANGFASDNAYATTTGNGNTLEYGLSDPSSSPGTITAVVLKAEVSISPFSNDGFDLRACISTTCSTQSGRLVGAASDTTISYTVTSLRPGGGSWSWSDITSLLLRVTTDRSGGSDGTWRIDRAWVEVTYAPAYSLGVQMDFSGVASGNTYTLGLNYRVTGDTYGLQVWDGSAWNTRGTTLSAAGLTQWTYTLTAAEYLSGAPRIRFTDATPSGTTQGNLYLDYVRVVTT